MDSVLWKWILPGTLGITVYKLLEVIERLFQSNVLLVEHGPSEVRTWESLTSKQGAVGGDAIITPPIYIVNVVLMSAVIVQLKRSVEVISMLRYAFREITN